MIRSPNLADDYADFIRTLKERVAAARLSAARAVNRELIALYWDIGKAKRGATTVVVNWPSSAAAASAAWLREILR